MDELIIIPGASTCSQRCNILYINEFTAQHNRMKNHSTAKRRRAPSSTTTTATGIPESASFRYCLNSSLRRIPASAERVSFVTAKRSALAGSSSSLGIPLSAPPKVLLRIPSSAPPKVLLMAYDSALSPLNLAMVGCLPTTATPVLLTEMSKPTTQPLSGA